MDSSQLIYHAEGAANIIYSFTPGTGIIDVNSTSLDTSEYVLRLRKDLPYVSSAATTVAAFEQYVKPLYEKKYLLEQMLVPLSSGLSSELNKHLRGSEDDAHVIRRDVKRQGVYLPSFEEEKNGILMPRLSASAANIRVLEFKPKWLVQSASAPLDSERCRTCAVRDMRDAKGHLHGRGSGSFCPLDLLYLDAVVNKTDVIRSLWPTSHVDTGLFVSEFVDKVVPLLRHLRNVQQKYDRVSLTDLETKDPDLPLAMAVRDCSVFVQCSNPSTVDAGPRGRTVTEIWDVKLADLDLKSMGGGKLERWIEMERELIQGGWYLGRSLDAAPRSICRIGRYHEPRTAYTNHA